MTYCVAIRVDQGLVMVADSRTNAGVDHVSTYSKMRIYGVPGQRQLHICSAGNLATTQAVIDRVEQDIQEGAAENLHTVTTVARAASYIGRLNVEEQQRHGAGDPAFSASFLVGGEIWGDDLASYLVYPEGNHIRSSRQTPYLQIGETMYGKPILDRVLTMDIALDTAAICGLVSMDGTMRSNVTVGPPIELVAYESASLQAGKYRKYEEGSEFLESLRRSWNALVKQAFHNLPSVDWYQSPG